MYRLFRVVLTTVAMACAAAFAVAAETPKSWDNMSFTSIDDMVLQGCYIPPDKKNGKVVVLLHGLGSNKEEWAPFMTALTKTGYGFLAYDARGHGKSQLDTRGNRIQYTSFSQPGPGSDWTKMVMDLDKAVSYLVDEKKIPLNRIILMGASLGANVCMTYAAANESVPLVILLSPGLNYAEYKTAPIIGEFKRRPIIFVVSPADSYSYQSCIMLYRQIIENRNAALLVDYKGHGVQMFDGKLERQLIRMMDKY